MRFWDKILNKIAYRSEYAKRCRKLLWIADSASRKLQQGYRERYVQPRCEFDELIKHREEIQKAKNEDR